jgi:hypothetical protein
MLWVSILLLATVAIGILRYIWPNVHLDGAEAENIFFAYGATHVFQNLY